jgi:hypothetical protein
MADKQEPEKDTAEDGEPVPALGPSVPEGVDAPEVKASGRPTKGVQPVEPDDIPEAGR